MSVKQGGNTIAGGGSVDQTYDGTSTNAQSGTAVAGAISNMVTTDTAQTISGEKAVENNVFKQIISGTGGYSIQGRSAKGNTPTKRDFAQFKYQDNSGDGGTEHRYGCVDFDVNLDKTTTATLRAYQNVAGSTSFAQINVSIAPDGTITTYAPACDNKNSIVTTTGINKDTNGYLKLGNDIIVQWGDHLTSSAGASTITLPTAFSDNNYSIVVTRLSGTSTTNESGSYYFRGRTTTNVSVYKTNNNTQSMMWIAVGY